MKGKIKKIVSEKNYGFIKTDEGEEVFFHRSELSKGLVFHALRKGQEVMFFVEETDKGKKATHIVKI